MENGPPSEPFAFGFRSVQGLQNGTAQSHGSKSGGASVDNSAVIDALVKMQ